MHCYRSNRTDASPYDRESLKLHYVAGCRDWPRHADCHSSWEDHDREKRAGTRHTQNHDLQPLQRERTVFWKVWIVTLQYFFQNNALCLSKVSLYDPFSETFALLRQCALEFTIEKSFTIAELTTVPSTSELGTEHDKQNGWRRRWSVPTTDQTATRQRPFDVTGAGHATGIRCTTHGTDLSETLQNACGIDIAGNRRHWLPGTQRCSAPDHYGEELSMCRA